jgi:hypothetical protein
MKAKIRRKAVADLTLLKYLAVLFERVRSQGVLLLPQAVFDRILEYDCLDDGNNL